MNKKLLLILTFGLLALTQTTDAWWGRGWGWGGGWGGWGGWGLGFGLGYPYYGWGGPGWGWGGGWGWPGYYESPEAIRARTEYYEQRRNAREIRDLSNRLPRLERQLVNAKEDLLEAQQEGNQTMAQRITISVNSLNDQINFIKQRIMSLQQPVTQADTRTTVATRSVQNLD